MWGWAGLAGRCGSQSGGVVVPRRLVVNAREWDDSRGVDGRGGPLVGFPACNGAAKTAELQRTVVAAARPPTGTQCLLKGKIQVFSCYDAFNSSLLAGSTA
jgi:hypothetical protein